VILIALLLFMAVTAFWLVWLRDLFAVVMLSGIYSLFAAALYVVMDAVDVAFTEAAVGAGISTVFMLGTLSLTTTREKGRKKPSALALVLVFVTGGVLIYGTFDMPRYGDANAPINLNVANRYIEKSAGEVGPPNIVTSVLASYRGFDTLGETAVVFTAAIGVLIIIGRSKPAPRNSETLSQPAAFRRRRDDPPAQEPDGSGDPTP